MKLQKAPLGLLGALDLKTTGENPIEFPSVLSAVLDASEFYFLPTAKAASATKAAAALVGDRAGPVTVPNGQVWLVTAMSLNLTANVGACAPRVNLNFLIPGTYQQCFQELTVSLAAAADQSNAGGLFPRYVLCPGGTNFYATLQNALGANNCDLQVRVNYFRFDA